MEAGNESVALLAKGEDKAEDEPKLTKRIWVESKKLWVIVGPAIFSCVVTYTMNVITQAVVGHLGDLELASISIANTVVVGFNFGLLGLTTTALKVDQLFIGDIFAKYKSGRTTFVVKVDSSLNVWDSESYKNFTFFPS